MKTFWVFISILAIIAIWIFFVGPKDPFANRDKKEDGEITD